MLLQLSHFFSPLYFPLPYTPLPPSFPHLSSCPWVIHISSLASLFPILFLTSPCLFCTYHLCFLFPAHFLPFSSFLSPLITLHVISISVILFLFQLFAQFVFVFLGSVVDSCQFVVILLFVFFIFFSQMSPFNISYNKGLVMMNSFNSILFGKRFICPSILNDSFAGQSTSFQPLLACKVSLEKSANSLMGTPLQVTLSSFFPAFKILSLSLILGILIMMCLGVCFLGSNFFGTLSFLDFLEVYFLCQTRGSSPSLCFQISFQFLVLPLLLLAPLLFGCWNV